MFTDRSNIANWGNAEWEALSLEQLLFLHELGCPRATTQAWAVKARIFLNFMPYTYDGDNRRDMYLRIIRYQQEYNPNFSL